MQLVGSIFFVNRKTVGPSKNVLWDCINLEVQDAIEGS